MTSPGPDTPAAPAEPASGSVSRPEPVVGAAAAASALTSLAGLVLLVLVLTHTITPHGQAVLGPALASAIPTTVGAVATLVAAYRARSKVTPLSDPVSAAGVALVELEEAGQTVADAVREVRRPPGKQRPDVADHAAPEG
jgi:hypothetical protein